MIVDMDIYTSLKKYFHVWKNIKPTKIAKIMKEQFYINHLRKQVCEIEEARLQFFDKVTDFRRELRFELFKEKTECHQNQECKVFLDAHIKNCTNGCTKYINHCSNKDDDGRCKHYRKQSHLQERLDMYDDFENALDWEYAELRYALKRAVRMQELGSS